MIPGLELPVIRRLVEWGLCKAWRFCGGKFRHETHKKYALWWTAFDRLSYDDTNHHSDPNRPSRGLI